MKIAGTAVLVTAAKREACPAVCSRDENESGSRQGF